MLHYRASGLGCRSPATDCIRHLTQLYVEYMLSTSLTTLFCLERVKTQCRNIATSMSNEPGMVQPLNSTNLVCFYGGKGRGIEKWANPTTDGRERDSGKVMFIQSRCMATKISPLCCVEVCEEDRATTPKAELIQEIV